MIYILDFILFFLIFIYFLPLKTRINFKNDNVCFEMETNVYAFFLNIYSCKMYFKRVDQDDKFEMKINTILGIRLYHLSIDIANLELLNDKPGIKYNIHKKTLLKLQKRNDRKFFSIHDTARIIFFISKNYSTLVNTIFNFLKSIVIYDFNLSVYIGLKDAAHTAIINGFAWIILSIGFMPIYNNSTFLVNPNINIKPIYGNNKLNTNFNCIFKIRCGNIIINGIKLLSSLKWR